MSLSLIKQEILESMLVIDKPARATQIAEETGKDFKPVMMHILGLTRMGFAFSPEKGQYAITEKGKQALGLPKITPEAARAIIGQTPTDKAFHFYCDIDKPSNLYATSLQDFSSKILKVDVESTIFHLNRGDFEAWFKGMGDFELAKKAELLKRKKTMGIELCKRLRELVENRRLTLTALAHMSP